METSIYGKIAVIERDNWWYRGRRNLIERIIRSLHQRVKNSLDAGCGVGANLEVLSRYCDSVDGIDISMNSINFCSEKGYKNLFNGSIEDYEFKKKYELILCTDVLEHVEDEAKAVRNLCSSLSEGGVLILTVPAHRFLWSHNDIIVRHIRRYEVSEIESLIKKEKLRILKIGYWNQSILLPALIYYTIISKLGVKDKQNNFEIMENMPNTLNYFLYTILRIENIIFTKARLLNGMTIVCVAKKATE